MSPVNVTVTIGDTGYNPAHGSHFTIERGGNCLSDSERFGTSERDEKKVLFNFSKSFTHYQQVRGLDLKILGSKMHILGRFGAFWGLFLTVLGRFLAEIGQNGMNYCSFCAESNITGRVILVTGNY